MAVTVFTLPDLGEGLDSADVVEWLAAPGDRVVADQPLVLMETDKAAVEVPAPWSGVLLRRLAEAGETVAVGAPLAEFSDAPRLDAGAIVGDPAPAEPRTGEREAAPPVSEVPTARNRARAAPAARALARERDVDLATLRGTGPGGAVTRADVARAAGDPDADAPARAASGGLSAARRAMAREMARAGSQVVPATLTDGADVTAWISPEADVLVRLVRAACAGARAEPALNGTFDPSGPSRAAAERVDLGVAVDTPDGLYVPVLRDAGAKSAAEIRAALDPLVAAARTRRLGAEAQAGATLSLSSFGPLGGRFAALVVRPPQIAILGGGRAGDTVGWSDDGPVRRVELPLSLTFDHRAATGGEAARFLEAVRRDLESPT